jgi:hypothetical protein
VQKYAGGVDDRLQPVHDQSLQLLAGEPGKIELRPRISRLIDGSPSDLNHLAARQGPVPEVGNELVDRGQVTSFHLLGYILAL